MSEPRILLFGCGNTGADPARALAHIENIELPDGRRLVLTAGKFDTNRRARTLNMEAGYPASLIAFQNRFRIADDIHARRHLEDGFDVLSISENPDRLSGFDFLIMVRTAFDPPTDWHQLAGWNSNQYFRLFGRQINAQPSDDELINLLFDLRGPDSLSILMALRDMFHTGSSFAVEPYSLEKLLQMAVDATGAVSRLGTIR